MLSASPSYNCSFFRPADVVDEVAVPLTSYSSIAYLKDELTLDVPILMITTPDEEGAVMTYLNDDYVYDDEFDFADSESDSDSDNNVFSESDSDSDSEYDEEDSMDVNFIVDQYFNSSEADTEEEDDDDLSSILDQFPAVPKSESEDDSLSSIINQFPKVPLSVRLVDEDQGESLMLSNGWSKLIESLEAESKATEYRKSEKGEAWWTGAAASQVAQVKSETTRKFKCNDGEAWWKMEGMQAKSEKARKFKCNDGKAWWKF
ncbi:hypothetical protein E1B28_002660 [Marasmius oreades]|uniref:Uncharacterized protein n=1 Tax=Marasmius oreades TaxID=181124 RepID=A0A9P7RN67_9AGAR|nr:uncharacterized protein E1B28_002660 [Marasmius oreades]KAG7086726.1 hypothetical protein E1B28_002660 [Marasmius oreades]